MRKVHISKTVLHKISELELFLKNELKFSKEAARKRSDRMRVFVASLRHSVDYALCRFKKWQELGYRCAVFEKDWVFAYEIFEDGVIVRDMSHTALLVE
jgi:hypothetical protein